MIFLTARLAGYEFYIKLSYLLSLSVSGDCLSRYISRLNEIIEVNKIIHSSLVNSYFKSNF